MLLFWVTMPFVFIILIEDLDRMINCEWSESNNEISSVIGKNTFSY